MKKNYEQDESRLKILTWCIGGTFALTALSVVACWALVRVWGGVAVPEPVAQDPVWLNEKGLSDLAAGAERLPMDAAMDQIAAEGRRSEGIGEDSQ